MFLYSPDNEAGFIAIADRLGITGVGNTLSKVEGLHFTSSIMPGSGRDLAVSDPYRSSLEVTLDDECEVFLEAAGSSQTPLIWRRKLGDGTVVFDNLNFLEKAYRGFHCAAFSLLNRDCIWPVINGSTFYIDDFPSPVPEGTASLSRVNLEWTSRIFTLITGGRMSIIWPKIQYPLYGLVIEDYSGQVSGVFPSNKDITRFQYFGNMLLREGGGWVHGYNHMPLVPENFDYLGMYDSYRQWVSVDAMRDSLNELDRFCRELFPEEEFHVYVPPSNIISEEGRALLAEDFPQIRAIASLYLPDDNDVSYSQDFTVTEDGMVQTPRIISGYVLDEYMRTAAMEWLYFHCVNTHFQHPDDTLDTDRGAALGWTELFRRLTDYVEWLHNALPQLRNLTGSELTGAVQRYDKLQIRREEDDNSIHLSLGGLKMKPGSTSGSMTEARAYDRGDDQPGC